MKQKKALTVSILFILFSVFFLSSCEESNRPVVLWTNQSEFVSYVELFNTVQDDVQVMVVYKDNPAELLPPPNDEIAPDIVVGPWLKNSTVRKNFMSLDHLFSQMQLSRSAFYPQLLEAGTINETLYLLPISFNLPAVILSSNNRSLLADNYMISLEEIRKIGAAYNKTNKSKLYTSMGFAPRWNPDFLYVATKLRNANYQEQGNSFSWNTKAFDDTVKFLKDWTLTANTSTSAEEDFKFKYLYTPSYTLVSSNRCLFASITSDELFNVNPEKLQGIDYRWLQENRLIPIEDRIISLGLYEKSKNTNAAEAFIIWFMQEQNQKAMLERSVQMKLNTTTFGISGGFSALRQVNERTFPLFYPMLMRNLPTPETLKAPNILPARWESIKERVILPYLEDATNTKHEEPQKTIKELLAEWTKQYY